MTIQIIAWAAQVDQRWTDHLAGYFLILFVNIHLVFTYKAASKPTKPLKS